MVAFTEFDGKLLSGQCAELVAFVKQAAVDGLPAHEVELALFRGVMKLGRELLSAFIELQGTGDIGPEMTLPDGSQLVRQPEIHERQYMTIFGEFTIQRTAYSQGTHRKAEMPLDARLQLPESKFSHLLQSWDQMIATEQPYGQVSRVMETIFEVAQHVDSLERMSRGMSGDAESYCWTRPAPPAAEEGEILVQSADGKGVPIRHPADTKPIEDHQPRRGPKPDRKRMATVGAIYSVDRFVRTPQQLLDALFREPNQVRDPDLPERPRPQHKLTYARLDDDPAPNAVNGQAAVFGWLAQNTENRLKRRRKEIPVIALMDGQESLWNMLDTFLGAEDMIKILDILHVTPRIWSSAKLFHESHGAQTKFVYEQTGRILNGEVKSVVHSLRSLATRRKLSKKKTAALEVICNYLLKNADRMRYNEYLAAGYPIASGVIEGACRHVVKDRMERTGMSWTRPGAQAMLNLRAIWTSDHWDDFVKYRVEKESDRLYPHRELLKAANWTFAA
jgi:hypothetical protein